MKRDKVTQLVAIGFPQSPATVPISVTSVKHRFPISEIDCSGALSAETLLFYHLMYLMLPESVCISFNINFHYFVLFILLYNVDTCVSLSSWEQIGV